jgi:hypothetical protein
MNGARASIMVDFVRDKLFGLALALYVEDWELPSVEVLLARLEAGHPRVWMAQATYQYEDICSYCRTTEKSNPRLCFHEGWRRFLGDRCSGKAVLIFRSIDVAEPVLCYSYCSVGRRCLPAFLASAREYLDDFKEEYEHLFVVLRMQTPVPKELVMQVFRFYLLLRSLQLWEWN